MNYKELKNIVQKHCDAYYDFSSTKISDKEFDILYEKLEEVESAQGWKAIDSPTVKIGGLPGKVEQPFKLYSLKKVYTPEEVDSSYDIETPKIDGANLTLIYNRGRLAAALTRGNGELGDNVVNVAKYIKNIPTEINTEFKQVVINGECVTDNNIDNFRNYVSGALSLKSSKEFKDRNILFIAHDFLGIALDYTTRMQITTNMGFFTVLDKKASKYPQDGIVFRINDYNKCKRLGYTSKFPRFAVALKERGVETAITTLQEVVWAVGRTGTVNPTAIIDPVVLEDATITRVTLHNMAFITDHNVGLGDSIEIERAGGVIPKFIKVIEHAKHDVKICKNDAEKYVGHKLVMDGPKLVVKDADNVNHSKILEHFITILGIKGLGPASIRKMKFKHPSDLYKDNNWDLLGANGSKVATEVRRSKNKPYATVLASLGIKGVGRSAAKLIVTKIPSFVNIKDIEYVNIKGIGAATIAAIMTWLEDNEEWVLKLPLQLQQDVQVDDIIDTPVRKVCITGKLDMTRTELSNILEEYSFKTTSTVTKDCYALISGGDNSSSKYKKAVSQNINIIDYQSRKKDVLVGNF